MHRTRMLFLAATVPVVLSAPALAQNFSGTYSAPDQQGGTLTLMLRQDAQQRVSGTFAGNGNTLRVQGQVQNGNVLGTVAGGSGAMYIVARIEGKHLRVLLAEVGPNGQPNYNAARQILMAPAPAPAGAAAKDAPPPRQQTQQAPQGSGSPVDAQLTQLLTSSPWCAFSYSQSSGASSKERILFGRDGMYLRQTGGEAYSSGYGGTYAGQSSGGSRGHWRVQSGGLRLSQDGSNWQPQALQVTRNSSGYPIINSGGREYTQCR